MKMAIGRVGMNWMRGVVVLAMLSAAAGSGLAQAAAAPAKDDLFAGTEIFAKGASNVTEISMDPNSLGMVNGKNENRAHAMILNVVRTYEYDKPGMYRIEDVDVYRNKLNTGDWLCSMHMRSTKEGESTDICKRRRTDDLSETAIITVEPKQLTFIHTIRKGIPGKSEMSGFMFDRVDGLPAMALLEPKLLEMQMSLQNLRLPNQDEIRAEVDGAMKNLPALDSPEMQKHFAEMQKKLEDAGKRLKDLQKLDELKKPDDAGKD
jgi:hypothetical protein